MPERPLHPSSMTHAPGAWWACSEPERPIDYMTSFDELCRWCMTKAHMASNDPELLAIGYWSYDVDGPIEWVTLGEFIGQHPVPT